MVGSCTSAPLAPAPGAMTSSVNRMVAGAAPEAAAAAATSARAWPSSARCVITTGAWLSSMYPARRSAWYEGSRGT